MKIKEAYKKIKAAERLNDIKYQSFGQIRFIHLWINYKSWNGLQGYKNVSYSQFKKFLVAAKNGSIDLNYGTLEALKRLCDNHRYLYTHFRYSPKFGIRKYQPLVVSECDYTDSIPF
jgi:hypothetical protein